ncbi:hypothetical protein [Sediminimonas sp.]|uniref:hypothetical protein n=1 Tax=Sediminimonas sp. TaxID=2823379 RepID=UPI0025F7FBD1|nr:hypothetical protein [Sediminimonas sp.]
MKHLTGALTAALLVAPHLAAADTTDPLVMTYEVFEESVPHIDLATCPGEMAGDDWFCRAVTHNDAFHVFAFLYEDGSPAVAYRAYSVEGLTGILK